MGLHPLVPNSHQCYELAMPDLRIALLIFALIALAWSMRKAAGKLAPRVAFAPLVFLATRWPVAAAWILGTLGWLTVLVPPMVARGRDSPSNLATALAISVLCGGGVAAIVVGPAFIAVRAFTHSPEVPLESGEELLIEVLANHFLAGEARGGKLRVTSRRLVFRPHRFNVQLSPWAVKLENIKRFEVEGEKFLVIHLKDAGDPHWLVVKGPSSLADFVTRVAEAEEAQRRNVLR